MKDVTPGGSISVLCKNILQLTENGKIAGTKLWARVKLGMRRINVTNKIIIIKCYCYSSLQNEEYCAFEFMFKITAFFQKYFFGIP